MRVKPIELSENERGQLQLTIKKGNGWRGRERAQTILMSSNGQTVAAVAGQQDLKPEAIRERRRKWRGNGLGSLPGQPRCGAPSKLVDGHRGQLKKWVDAGPLACRTLAGRLTADCGVTISAGTLRNELKRMGHVWKRTRHSLKKSVIRNDSNKPGRILQGWSSKQEPAELNWRMWMKPDLRRNRRTVRLGRKVGKPMPSPLNARNA